MPRGTGIGPARCGVAAGSGFVRARRGATDALELAAEADVLLQAPDVADHRVGDERDDDTRRAGAAGAARTVHVRLGVFGEVEVHDARDAVDVNAARRDIGRDERVDVALLERLQRTIALALRATTVDRRRATRRPRTAA